MSHSRRACRSSVQRRTGVAALLLSVVLTLPAHAADITVSAAASLTNAFKAVGTAFEKQYPQDKVTFNFAASDILVQQIVRGAPVDVFASADQIAMDRAVQAGAVAADTRQDFAANQIVMIVPAGRNTAPQSITELTQDGVKRVAYGNPASVPVGRYTQAALERDGVWAAVAAKGVPAQNVRQSLDYVARGEVDAGFVFATDAAIMTDRVKVAAQLPSVTPVTYPIARTARSAVQADADRFIAFVNSAQGQAILSSFGFESP